MNAVDEIGPERGGDDMIAAEYVLGVLPADERLVVADRIEADRDFAQIVDGWELHFAPLAAGYPDAEPPPAVKAVIDRRLFAERREDRTASSRPGLWSSLAFWRGLATAALAALAIYIALPFYNRPVQPQTRLVASLVADASDVRYLVLYDAAEGDVALSHVSGERGDGRDFELWMIEGKNAPVSMGIIPVGQSTHVLVSPIAKQKLAAGAVFAVSLEPAGGSPTGQPTGPVVAAGDLKSI